MLYYSCFHILDLDCRNTKTKENLAGQLDNCHTPHPQIDRQRSLVGKTDSIKPKPSKVSDMNTLVDSL